MSATQPSFQSVDPNFERKCIDIIDRSRSEYFFKEERLVKYQIITECWTWKRLAQLIANYLQFLAIINTNQLSREG